jgi:hypothetical protein
LDSLVEVTFDLKRRFYKCPSTIMLSPRNRL